MFGQLSPVFWKKKTVPIFCVVVMTVLSVDWRSLKITELSGYKSHVYLNQRFICRKIWHMVHLRCLASREWLCVYIYIYMYIYISQASLKLPFHCSAELPSS